MYIAIYRTAWYSWCWKLPFSTPRRASYLVNKLLNTFANSYLEIADTA